ncbi:MAG: hypothetical protein ACREDR_38480, partial [Blastocatellia bacterium]
RLEGSRLNLKEIWAQLQEIRPEKDRARSSNQAVMDRLLRLLGVRRIKNDPVERLCQRLPVWFLFFGFNLLPLFDGGGH